MESDDDQFDALMADESSFEAFEEKDDENEIAKFLMREPKKKKKKDEPQQEPPQSPQQQQQQTSSSSPPPSPQVSLANSGNATSSSETRKSEAVETISKQHIRPLGKSDSVREATWFWAISIVLLATGLLIAFVSFRGSAPLGFDRESRRHSWRVSATNFLFNRAGLRCAGEKLRSARAPINRKDGG